MNSYTVFVNSIYRDIVLVTASSEEEARQNVMKFQYDDIVSSEFTGNFIEDSMEVRLDEEDVDEDDE